MIWGRCLACEGEMKNSYEVLFRKPERKLLLTNLSVIRRATLKK
jgi:hypothetical protein